MSETTWLSKQFDKNRRRPWAVAYRMLGSLSDADDAVQETWLRLNRSGADGVENPAGWLTTVVSRVCLDMLRARRSRRENSLDTHLPDPILTRDEGTDPERGILLADSVGLALLILLETLPPPERLAFVLHDTFGMPTGPGCYTLCIAVCFSNGTTRRTAGTRRSTQGSTFESASRVFADPDLLLRKDRVVDNEERWHAIGAVQTAVLLVVHVYREESDGEEIIRIISAREADPQERRIYLEQAAD